MQKRVVAALLGGALLALAAGSQRIPRAPTPSHEVPSPADVPSHHAHTEPDCEAGCSLGDHPVEPLTRTGYLGLIERFGRDDAVVRAEALDALLFHSAQTRQLLRTLGTGSLGDNEAEFLRREASRTHVRLWFRVVDERGAVRAEISGVRVPIGEKTHVSLSDTYNLPPPEVSGTVHRTGLHHLWTRI